METIKLTKKREIRRVHDLLKNMHTFDRPLRIEVNQMRSGVQAQEEYYVECEKDTVTFHIDEEEFVNQTTNETKKVTVTTLYTETTKPAMFMVLGKLPELIYHTNKNTMAIYKKYKDIAAVALLFVWQMVNIHLMLDPAPGELVMEFWKDPWVMFFAGAGLMLLLTLKALNDDYSLAVLKLTVQHEKITPSNRIAHFCTSSQMSFVRQLKLFGVDTPEEIAEQQNKIFHRLLVVTAERWEILRNELKRSSEEGSFQTQENRKRSFLSPGEQKLAMRKTEMQQTVGVLGVCGAIFLGFIWLVITYGG